MIRDNLKVFFCSLKVIRQILGTALGFIDRTKTSFIEWVEGRLFFVFLIVSGC